MSKLAALNAWELMVVLLAVATAAALAVWGLVWVMWTVRPLLAAAASLAAVCGVLYAVRTASSERRLEPRRVARLLNSGPGVFAEGVESRSRLGSLLRFSPGT